MKQPSPAAAAAAGTGAANVWPPRVLDTIYRDRVQTFYDLLLHLLTSPSSGSIAIDGRVWEAQKSVDEFGRPKKEVSGAAPRHASTEGPYFPLENKEAQRILARKDDPLGYATMLNKSYAVMPETAPAMGPVIFEQRWTQQQIVERVIELQFRHEAKPSHVLCSGYRKLRPSLIGSSGRRAPVGLECVSGNAAVDIVNSDSWRLLLSRVGDSVMLHILSHAAIFTPLPNDCLLQISGVPISSSVSVFRKSSLLHTGEKMLRSHGKRKLVSQTYSAQAEGRIPEMGKKHGHFEAAVEKPPEVFEATCEFGDGPLSQKNRTCCVVHLESNAHDKYDGNSMLLQTSCIISRRHRAKRKAQESIVKGDRKLPPGNENLLPDGRKRRKLESRVQVGKTAENCGEGLKTDTRTQELLVNGKEDHSYYQTSSLHSPMKGSVKFREAALQSTRPGEKHIKQRINNRIPIGTPNKASRKTGNLSLKDAEGDRTELTKRTLCTDNTFLGSENASRPEGTSSNLPESAKTKRVRPPSWKRRKIHRQGQDLLCQELPSQSLEGHVEEGSRMSSVKKLKIPEAEDQTNLDSLHVLHFSPCRQQTSGTEFVVRSTEDRDIVQETTAPFSEQEKVSQSTKRRKDHPRERTGSFSEHEKVYQSMKRKNDNPRRCAGPSQMLINRASIFYNSNFSRHPGLPANHILNRTKPDDDGVVHLYAAIFGSLKDVSASSFADPTFYTTPTRLLGTLLKQLLAKVKRCAYARLLRRHCPLPRELNSQLAELATPFLTAATAPLLESQNGLRSSQSVVEKHETENLEQDIDSHSPEVEEVMKLLLGPLYQPSGTGVTKPFCSIDSSNEAHATSILSSGEHKADANNQRFKECKLEKDFADATHTANVATTDKALRAGLIASYTDHSSVVSFLWAACRSIIPPEMLGSKRSWRTLRSNIAHFVSLRRHEKFNVQHILFNLKLSSHSWLGVPSTASERATSEMPKPSSDTEERVLQQKKLELWLYWLFTNLVVPLIRCHFYVTEIENHRQNVFYYRKPVWAKLRNIALKDLTQRNYKELSKKSVAAALDGKALGFSQVRLLPKRTGVRPIANLAAPSQGTLKFRVKSEKRPTLRQLFGDLERAIHCEAESLKGCNSKSSVVGDNPVVEPFKEFSPQKSGQTSVFGQSQVFTSRTFCKDWTKASSSDGVDKPLVDSFTNFSSEESRQSPAKIHLNTPTTWYQNSPKVNCTNVRVSPGSGWNQTTPCKEVIPSGGVKKCRVQRKSVKGVNYSFRSVNSVLRDAHFCLKLEKDSYPEDLGSSVFGYSDIHSKVLPFILQIKGSGAVPRLYMVVCDVTKAYDTIRQEKLLEIVSAYLRSSEYSVTKYISVTPTLASVRISHGRAPSRACERQNFSHLVHNLAVKHSHCIFTDQGLCACVRREKILVLLEEHLKHNIVQIGKQFYQQTVGIPQGSTLSSILCSLFYGHFELHRLMPNLQSRLTEKLSLSSTGYLTSACGLQLRQTEILATQTTEIDVENMLESSFDILTQDSEAAVEESAARCNPHCSCLECKKSDHQYNDIASSVLKNSILLRLIDDSFFISTSEAAATIFVESMHMGSEEYGCHANKRKTAASFSLQLGKRVLAKKIYTTEDGACFMRWSGLLVNCYTVEFQADYTRYSGEHIRSTLTVKRERNQGWHLVLKMCQYMRPKCHALFFDPRINSPATIRLNAFQAFLLCAMKFHAYVCCLPRVTGHNQPFLYEVICCTTRYMYGLLRHRMETVGARAIEYFPFVELEWLALVAFYRTLKRKQSRYRMLLEVLQTQLEAARYTKMTSCPHLSSATDEKRSSMFKYIKY